MDDFTVSTDSKRLVKLVIDGEDDDDDDAIKVASTVSELTYVCTRLRAHLLVCLHSHGLTIW